MLGQAVQVQQLDVGHRPGGSETGHVGHGRVSAQVEEHSLTLDPARAAVTQLDVDRPLADEACFAHDELGPARPVAVEMKPAQVVDHGPLPGLHALHAGHRRLQRGPEFGCPHRERADLRRMDDVLARQARDVRARPPDQLPLDDGGVLAFGSRRPGKVFAGFTAADDENVVGLGRGRLPRGITAHRKLLPSSSRIHRIAWSRAARESPPRRGRSASPLPSPWPRHSRRRGTTDPGPRDRGGCRGRIRNGGSGSCRARGPIERPHARCLDSSPAGPGWPTA